MTPPRDIEPSSPSAGVNPADSTSGGTRVPVVQRQLRDFGVGALAAIIIATVAFVAVRNKELAARQIDVATRAVDALVIGKAPLPLKPSAKPR